MISWVDCTDCSRAAHCTAELSKQKLYWFWIIWFCQPKNCLHAWKKHYTLCWFASWPLPPLQAALSPPLLVSLVETSGVRAVSLVVDTSSTLHLPEACEASDVTDDIIIVLQRLFIGQPFPHSFCLQFCPSTIGMVRESRYCLLFSCQKKG